VKREQAEALFRQALREAAEAGVQDDEVVAWVRRLMKEGKTDGE
jgi:hypothetical protein